MNVEASEALINDITAATRFRSMKEEKAVTEQEWLDYCKNEDASLFRKGKIISL